MSFQEFKGFKAFRAKHFTPWYRAGKRMWPTLEPFALPEEPVNTELTELTNWLNGDEKTAKRVLTLRKENPYVANSGTVPELVTMDWLEVNKYRYIYQGMLFGGRALAGGLVPDFVVDTSGSGEGAAWQIQGDYWHSKSATKTYSDAADNLRLVGQVIGGIRIGKVIPIFESDIKTRRPQVFQMALAGISLR
jgi:hypothetical protein